ncbi:MAG: phage major capsid protein [Spirochaetales bacterium]|nr:phage major capsid protein [Spirochaetales bacterium]
MKKKFQNYTFSELKSARATAADTVAKYAKAYNSNERLTDAEKETARIALEERDYLSGAIDLVSPVAASSGPAAGIYGSASAPRVDFKKIGLDFQAMIAACAPADFDLPKIGEFPIGRVDARLLNMGSTIRSAATGANETVPSEGGFVVNTDFENAIMQSVFADSPLLPLLREITISSNSNGIKINMIDETSRATGSRWGGVTGYWLAEAATKTASKPKLRQIELMLKKVAALVYLTDELLMDAEAFGKAVFDAMAAELRFQIQDAVINGSGAGRPQGILNSPALVTQAAEGGQAAGSIVWENIKKMWARYIGGSPLWLINRDIVPELYGMSQAVGTGGAPVYLPASQSGTDGAAKAPMNSLMGARVIELEQCATLGTVGDIMLIDPLEYVLARKGAIQTAMSIHVQFLQDETVLRSVARVDGQTGLNSPVTPFKGSATRSPFVALATRS